MNITHILYLSEKPDTILCGGAENHLFALFEELIQRNLSIELIVITFYDGPKLQDLIINLKFKGINTYQIKRKKYNQSKIQKMLYSFQCYYHLYKLLKVKRGNIIHCHIEYIFVPLVAILSGCKKLIYSIHNDEPYFKKTLWKFWLLFIDKYILHYIAITDRVKSFYLHEIKVNPSKITTIYYGIKINNNSIYKNILSNKLLIGFMGRLTEQKNLFSLIDCMKLLPNDICHIYGDGPLKDEINEYLKFNKIHNVLLKGSVLNGSQIIETFDVLCLPSKWEGLGLVLLEAMSNKVPIIASTAGAIPEILDNGKYGVIIEPTPINLATAISEMKNNSQKIGVVVENAYQYVKMTFSIPKMAESTLSVYKTYSYED